MRNPSRCSTLVLITATILSASAAAQQAHWQLNETTGTTAKDATANQNDGTLKNFTGTPWATGKFGNALSFDGTDDYVEVKPKKGLPIYDGKGTPYSIAFWTKAGPQEDRRVYAEGNGSGKGAPLFTIGTGRVSRNTGGKLHVFVRNDANRPVLNHSSTATVFDNKWHHVAWVDVGGRATLYVDGVKDTRNFDYTSTNAAAGRGTQTNQFGTYDLEVAAIGAVLRTTACCFFKGAVDDLRVYRFALSVADIKLLILTAAKSFPPCTASVGKFGYGCGTVDITATGSAQSGKVLALQLTKGAPNAAALLLVGAPVSPLDLSVAGFPGCVAYPALATSLLVGIGKLNATGASNTVRITMPNSPVCLVGVIQGVTMSGTKLELSSAILAQLGK